MIGVEINLETGEVSEIKTEKRLRTQKGKSLLQFPEEYVVIDIETTGLSPQWDEIIEVAALKILNGEIVDKYQTLLKPSFPVDPFISELTGITNKMLETAPIFDDIYQDLQHFIGDNILVGHNVNFDINFLYDEFESRNIILSNNFIDTMRISRRLFKDERHHRLSDLIQRHNIIIDKDLHRAEVDINATNKAFEIFKQYIIDQKIDLEKFSKKNYTRKSYKVSDISTENTKFNENTPIYGQHFVFTGKLEVMVRKDAQQLVKDLGGELDNSVTKSTNFLVLGEQDYSKIKKLGKSNKHIKAEKLKAQGQEIEIIPETVFYDFLEECTSEMEES
ncbi:exonuclease domain-containing protein [Lactococcus lactis]|uniref:exonuclease domain-containing protein n=1 Tax=Lactococcus lactis TaxID=1358 RepID=UPI0024A999EE|nr:exonuclease domain-containing protein [Lactococcus lactis]